MRNSFLIMVLICVLGNAQTHRFIYDIEYRKDSTSQLTAKKNYNLDITKDKVLYYTRDYFVADSLISNNIPIPEEMKLNTSNIIEHKIGSISYDEYDVLENTILKLRTDDHQNWKLTDEKKQVKNLSLQKAVATWGGRNWIAFFTPEIPFQDGPYKFHGLPGLIVELYDDRDNYHFQLVKSEVFKDAQENQFIAEAIEMSVPTSWEKYKSTKQKYFQSPIDFIKNAIGESTGSQFYLNDGTVVDAKNSREVNEHLKNAIKQYNNPIEIDKAIIYPNN